MAKNIVVYSDGTGQDGGARPEQRISNIYKMYRISRDHAGHAHRSVAAGRRSTTPGLGTDIGATALTAPVRFVQKLLGLGHRRAASNATSPTATNSSSTTTKPGDRIFLFGFSRGAYTVRSLANLLMLCGVPTKTPGRAADAVPQGRQATSPGRPSTPCSSTAPAIRARSSRPSGSNWQDASRSNTDPATASRFQRRAVLHRRVRHRRGPGRQRNRDVSIIQAGLLTGVAAAAFIASLVAVPIAAVITASFGAGFCDGFIGRWPPSSRAAPLAGSWYWRSTSTTQDDPRLPEQGRVAIHQAMWKGANFDRLLSRHVALRAVRQRDRRDPQGFDRVGWGGTERCVQVAGHAPLRPEVVRRQSLRRRRILSGAGIHASRTSRCEWMCNEAVSVPDGLMTGPIFVDGVKLPKHGRHRRGAQHLPRTPTACSIARSPACATR